MGIVHRFFRAPVVWTMRLARVLRRHWLRTTAGLILLLAGAVVAAEMWTSVMWGSVGEWVSGIGALAAVVVALWTQARNHALEERYRREDYDRWRLERSEDRERWDFEREAQRKRDLAERAERAYRELVVTTSLTRLERVVEFDIAVTNNGQFPYRSFRAECQNPDVYARYQSTGSFALEIGPTETKVLKLNLSPELPDNWTVNFRLFFKDYHGNDFVYTKDYEGVQVTSVLAPINAC